MQGVEEERCCDFSGSGATFVRSAPEELAKVKPRSFIGTSLFFAAESVARTACFDSETPQAERGGSEHRAETRTKDEGSATSEEIALASSELGSQTPQGFEPPHS